MIKQLTFLAILLAGQVCLAGTIHVPGDYPTIQAGIDAASLGDIVLVAPGTYTGDGNRDIDLTSSASLLQSEAGPENTIIDCEGSPTEPHRGFRGSSNSCEIEGFTIRNGYHSHGGGYLCEGGNRTIKDCVFTGCTSSDGGGVYYTNAEMNIVNCEFVEDTAAYFGGAICCWSSTINLSGCDFTANMQTVQSGEIDMAGGTCIFLSDSYVYADDCTFSENNSRSLGTVITAHTSAIFEANNCVITENDGVSVLFLIWGAIGTLTDCVISGSLCDAVMLFSVSEIYLNNCTLADNYGGIYVLSDFHTDIHLDNTLITGSAWGAAIHGYTAPSVVDISCTNIFGNADGDWVGHIAGLGSTNGNFSADPRFCDPESGDYRINMYSPCAPNYSPCGELVGALGIACESVPDCGDPDVSGFVDIDDLVYLISFIFTGGLPPIPMEIGDVDCSGGVDIDDVVYMVSFIFLGGPEPCADCP